MTTSGGSRPSGVEVVVNEWDESLFDVEAHLEALPGWKLTAWLSTTPGFGEVVALTIEREDDTVRGLNRSMLASIDIGEIQRAAALQLTGLSDRFSALGLPSLDSDVREAGRALGKVPRPGPRGHPKRFYALMAAEYVRRVVLGGETVEQCARRQHLSAARFRNILTTARDRRLLTAAPPGRVGGELTPEAIELLEEESDDGKH